MPLFTPAEVDARIQKGKIIDGKTMIGFLAWRKYFAKQAGPGRQPAPR